MHGSNLCIFVYINFCILVLQQLNFVSEEEKL